MDDRHQQQGRDGDQRMVTEHVLAGGDAGEGLGVGQLGRDRHVVRTQRGRDDRGGGGHHGRGAQRAHARLTHDRVQGGQQDDGQVRGARHDQREQVAQQERDRNEHIRRLDVGQRLREHADGDVVGADLGHVGGVAAQDQDDETGGGQGGDELITHHLERIQPRHATGREVRERDGLAHQHGDIHQQDADQEQ